MDCGAPIDVQAVAWYRMRNPTAIPQRCSFCAFDLAMYLIEKIRDLQDEGTLALINGGSDD